MIHFALRDTIFFTDDACGPIVDLSPYINYIATYKPHCPINFFILKQNDFKIKCTEFGIELVTTSCYKYYFPHYGTGDKYSSLRFYK